LARNRNTASAERQRDAGTVRAVVDGDRLARWPRGRVVVALDEWPGSRVALAWARDEARRRDAGLEIVSSRLDLGFLDGDGFGGVEDGMTVAERARAVQLQLVREVLDGSPADVPTQLVLAWATLPMAVAARAPGCDLVVVPSGAVRWRHRRRQRRLRRNLRDAGCPVVAISPGVVAAPSPPRRLRLVDTGPDGLSAPRAVPPFRPR
jgi:hypothetical protein